MFTNYFKLAIKVLRRRKFFTFVSLFGISFTLMILMLITSFLDTELGGYPPLSKKDNMVFVPQYIMKKMRTDTLLVIDSTLVNNVYEYDTTYDYNEYANSYSSSAGSYKFMDEHLRNVPFVENYTFFSPNHTYDIFKNSNKLIFGVVFTDASFWEIHDFEFLEGASYASTDVKNQAQVTVITEKAATQYFGKTEGVIGEEMVLDKKHYKVIGIIKPSRTAKQYLNAEAYIPLTNLSAKQLAGREGRFLGSFNAVFLAKKPNGRQQIQAELKKIADDVQMPNPEEFNVFEMKTYTFIERYAQNLVYEEDSKKSVRKVFLGLMILLLLFILLPTLNLININISRILERSSEIGVRKAFGAHSGNILIQFVFENVIITFIGGVIGCVLALWLLNVINNSQALPNIELTFNYRVFAYSVLVCLVFGVLSGIIPAYRMSKLQIVKALKQRNI